MTRIELPLAMSTWDSAEYEALQEVISSGRFTMGAKVRAFEEQFAEFVGARHAVMVNSGSSANLIGLAAVASSAKFGLHPGDEIIVPAVSWATTYYPIRQLGFTPVLVDIDIDTLNIDPEKASEAITDRTRAIFAVNLLGNPAPLKELTLLAQQHSLLLFEDNCESLGATLDGRQTGTFGVFGTFSSFFSHHISTMEGGLIVTDDDYLYQAMVSMRAHGWTRELPEHNLIHPKTGDPFEDLFRFVLPGYNMRPLELSGALGVTQLAKLPGLLAGRRDNATAFRDRFGALPSVRVQQVAATAESSWFGFSLVLDEVLTGKRPELIALLTKVGVECRPIVAGNFARNPVMSRIAARVAEPLIAADKIHRDGFFVGNHHFPVARELNNLGDLISDFASQL